MKRSKIRDVQYTNFPDCAAPYPGYAYLLFGPSPTTYLQAWDRKSTDGNDM
jgi:hypothetical protein